MIISQIFFLLMFNYIFNNLKNAYYFLVYSDQSLLITELGMTIFKTIISLIIYHFYFKKESLVN